ncbi:nucleotidyltransferase domain-containing protein [Candidatus Woesearchaeota archaeon]|nr:nucleotidyltransferase domain-containing protein [Candidatus Woesearchaeota archaeon]
MNVKTFMVKIRNMTDFNRVKFILLYGSVAKKKNNKLSDIDFCVYYDGNKEDAYKFRMRLLGDLNEKYDVHIFNSLPLYLKKEVLKGRIIYFKNSKFLYDVYYSTIKKFDDFKKHYYRYIGYNEKRN